MIEFIFWPIIACIALVFIHGYFGAFVLRRGIIFIDLALAQWAALGYLVGHWFGIHSSIALFLCAFGFTLIASLILVGLKPFYDKVNQQEASIGVTYIFATTLATALISTTGLEGHHLKEMLSGHLLFVQPTEVLSAMVLYAIIAVILFKIQGAVLSNSSRWSDIAFYALFGLVVTSSVKMVGILLVFSFLVIPLLTVRLSFTDLKQQVLSAWGLGIVGAFAGIALAIPLDIPLSLSIILVYMLLFFGNVIRHSRGPKLF